MENIFWSIDAIEDFEENIEYLENKFSENEVLNFTSKTIEVLNIISKKPKTFKPIKYKSIHAALIVPQITLYYRIKNKTDIELIRFWNNYKNPNNLGLK